MTSSFIEYANKKYLSRYRDPQLLVSENNSYLFNLGPNICLNAHFIPNKSDLMG